MSSAADSYVATARRRIRRVDAAEARQLQLAGALLVDTRPAGQRHDSGTIPGAIVVERNHLEWRLDARNPHHHPSVAEHHGPIVVFCHEGYASSLAVAALGDIGVGDVVDLADGYLGWAAAGLPVDRSDGQGSGR